MKVSCTQENLQKGLSIVSRSVGIRTTLPVLNNILLKTEKGRLKISATDLEVGISTWVGAKVDREGAITCPSKLLLDYINTNNDKKINLELKELNLHLESEHYKANIKGIDASEFPLIPEVKKTQELEVLTQDLANAISKTVIASALDESRPVLAGVFVEASNDKMKMVATDSYRLAEQKINLTKKADTKTSFILPQRTMIEVARILDLGAEKVKIYPSENQAEFVLGETILVSRLIEGAFPDYEQIIPKNITTKMQANSSEFAIALKMASLFARESANNIKLKIAPPDKVSVLAVSPHVGDNVSEVKGTISGNALEIAFNAKFILDVLSVIGSEEVSLELSGNLAPGILRGKTNPNYLYVIMPLRIEE
ncbi:DNA polymerase III subunit beta [Candidatus Berkelbacteria bacterium RBG_13_40_8]|uniref:Beta sliding clamp n=1 Tax=Candidatus Berkelbacteria bacterium RBG_13_40_8 TaxID=1797467 RepID=A0A1F5DPW1_9BACT|nr:MAG: DNA polymerase III subunit beta [Candidatus Berkelbacteria bacterium RBG_13_40_8]